MNRILYISLSVILFISCGNKDREILVKLMQEWKGREILYPNDMHFFMQGRDTLNADSICMYKIITYIDSIGCMSCKLGLSQWQDFAVNVDSIFPNTVHFQFVFQPYKLNEIRLLWRCRRLFLRLSQNCRRSALPRGGTAVCPCRPCALCAW